MGDKVKLLLTGELTNCDYFTVGKVYTAERRGRCFYKIDCDDVGDSPLVCEGYGECSHAGTKAEWVIVDDNNRTAPVEEDYTQPVKANDKQIGGNHYKLAIEPWDYIIANDLGYLEGNIVKYVSRYKAKNGAQDLDKALHYLEKLIELEKEKL